MSAELWSWLWWAIGGFLVGLAAGRLERERARRAEFHRGAEFGRLAQEIDDGLKRRLSENQGSCLGEAQDTL